MLLYVDAKGCKIQPTDWRRWPSISGHPSRRWVRTRFRGGTSSHIDTHELIYIAAVEKTTHQKKVKQAKNNVCTG